MKFLSLISLLVICHAIFSTLRWRKFLQGNAQQVAHLPIDIMFEIFIGACLACYSIASNGSKLKKINTFERQITYDKALQRKNFKTYNSSRAQILKDIVQTRLNLDYATA